ncbi:unnamed protein product [Rangifer tarandus platyrhynchus]|uniref:Uncharacterized protein n=2 Tax=Rangifer tarandus platyrhynchus TaxID=3082113 RepID=A0ABN8Y7W5_RANTA|nr:unnamed protein product [Rangifer tarandus platyrhynchus]CAI9695160.1 unnamed protein product [Rangifer tarandus platyrhynchus]
MEWGLFTGSRKGRTEAEREAAPGREGHVRSGRRAGPRSRGSGEAPTAGPTRIRLPRGGSALRRGRVCLRQKGRPSIEDRSKAFLPRPPQAFNVLRLLGKSVFGPT